MVMPGSCLENKSRHEEGPRPDTTTTDLMGKKHLRASLPTFTNLQGQTIHSEQSLAVYNLAHLKETPYVVVMIGGLMETQTHWKAFQEKLDSNKVSWATISLEGFDGRPKNTAYFTAENSYKGTKKRIQAIKQLECSDPIKIILVGHSLGANVSFKMAKESFAGLEIVETHLLNPAINPSDKVLKGLLGTYSAVNGIPGSLSACKLLVSAAELLHAPTGELSLTQYLKSPKAKNTDAPGHVYFSGKVPASGACEAIKLADDLKTALEDAENKGQVYRKIFAYESPVKDALLDPALTIKRDEQTRWAPIRTTPFADSTHFTQTDNNGLGLLQINKINVGFLILSTSKISFLE